MQLQNQTPRATDWKDGGWHNMETRADSVPGYAKNSGKKNTGIIPRITTKKENRINRLKAIGNGQVPICAATAWRLLTQ